MKEEILTTRLTQKTSLQNQNCQLCILQTTTRDFPIHSVSLFKQSNRE